MPRGPGQFAGGLRRVPGKRRDPDGLEKFLGRSPPETSFVILRSTGCTRDEAPSKAGGNCSNPFQFFAEHTRETRDAPAL